MRIAVTTEPCQADEIKLDLLLVRQFVQTAETFLTLVIQMCLSTHIKYNVSVNNTTALLHKMLFYGEMFRLFLSNLQEL